MVRSQRPWLRRFVVEGDSMRPALSPGDGLMAVRSRRARVGQLRLLEHPLIAGMWLVKRVDTVAPDGTMTVMSDNREATRADSRSFGSVSVAGTYRVVARLPRRLVG